MIGCTLLFSQNLVDDMLKPGSNNHVHHLCPDLDISPKAAHAIQQEQLEANAVQQMQQMQFSVTTFMATEKVLKPTGTPNRLSESCLD